MMTAMTCVVIFRLASKRERESVRVCVCALKSGRSGMMEHPLAVVSRSGSSDGGDVHPSSQEGGSDAGPFGGYDAGLVVSEYASSRATSSGLLSVKGSGGLFGSNAENGGFLSIYSNGNNNRSLFRDDVPQAVAVESHHHHHHQQQQQQQQQQGQRAHFASDEGDHRHAVSRGATRTGTGTGGNHDEGTQLSGYHPYHRVSSGLGDGSGSGSGRCGSNDSDRPASASRPSSTSRIGRPPTAPQHPVSSSPPLPLFEAVFLQHKEVCPILALQGQPTTFFSSSSGLDSNAATTPSAPVLLLREGHFSIRVTSNVDSLVIAKLEIDGCCTRCNFRIMPQQTHTIRETRIAVGQHAVPLTFIPTDAQRVPVAHAADIANAVGSLRILFFEARELPHTLKWDWNPEAPVEILTFDYGFLDAFADAIPELRSHSHHATTTVLTTSTAVDPQHRSAPTRGILSNDKERSMSGDGRPAPRDATAISVGQHTTTRRRAAGELRPPSIETSAAANDRRIQSAFENHVKRSRLAPKPVGTSGFRTSSRDPSPQPPKASTSANVAMMPAPNRSTQPQTSGVGTLHGAANPLHVFDANLPTKPAAAPPAPTTAASSEIPQRGTKDLTRSSLGAAAADIQCPDCGRWFLCDRVAQLERQLLEAHQHIERLSQRHQPTNGVSAASQRHERPAKPFTDPHALLMGAGPTQSRMRSTSPQVQVQPDTARHTVQQPPPGSASAHGQNFGDRVLAFAEALVAEDRRKGESSGTQRSRGGDDAVRSTDMWGVGSRSHHFIPLEPSDPFLVRSW